MKVQVQHPKCRPLPGPHQVHLRGSSPLQLPNIGDPVVDLVQVTCPDLTERPRGRPNDPGLPDAVSDRPTRTKTPRNRPNQTTRRVGTSDATDDSSHLLRYSADEKVVELVSTSSSGRGGGFGVEWTASSRFRPRPSAGYVRVF